MEGMWAVVLLIGLVFLVAIPIFIAGVSTAVCMIAARIKDRRARFAIVGAISAIVLCLLLIVPYSRYGMMCSLQTAGLMVLIACAHVMTTTAFEGRLDDKKRYVLAFVSAALGSAGIMFAYISVGSIPAYFEILGRLQFVLYFTGSLLVSAALFLAATRPGRRPDR